MITSVTDLPPLPPGHILLGLGNTFKTGGYFEGYCFDPDAPVRGWTPNPAWLGNYGGAWYAAPIGSDIARLNGLGPTPIQLPGWAPLAEDPAPPTPVTAIDKLLALQKEVGHLKTVLARKNRKIARQKAQLDKLRKPAEPEYQYIREVRWPGIVWRRDPSGRYEVWSAHQPNWDVSGCGDCTFFTVDGSLKAGHEFTTNPESGS